MPSADELCEGKEGFILLMKKILILTAERSGTGHKSAANAIEKELDKEKYTVKQVDSFTLMGKIGTMLENSYIPITTKFPILFYISYLWSQIFSNTMHFLIYSKLKNRLKKEILEFQPDLIITVHSMFTKAVSHVLQKEKLDIPFYVDVIDLVKPPRVWYDKNADTIFVPTEDVKNTYIEKGYSKDKIIVSGFPIREDIVRRVTPKEITGKINILLVNPSVNLKRNIKFVKEVSKIENADISVICGRDERLYKRLITEQKKGNISKKVQIHGFVNNINEYLEKAHIILAKAGPNMILEAARSGTAIIVTDYIKGQENYNYEYVVNNDFGFKCTNPNEIYKKITNFIDTHKLEKCLNNVINSDCNNGASIIAEYINNNIN